MPFSSSADARIVIDADFGPVFRGAKAAEISIANIGRGARGLNTESFVGPLGRISGKANEFQKSLAAAEARVLAFGATAGTIYALKSAFEALVQSTVKVEKAIVDINVLLNLTTNSLGKFSSDLFNIADRTGTSFYDAAKAAQEFARQGLGAEVTLQRTSAAMQLARISGIDLDKAVSSITATLEGFSNEALTAEQIINKLAAVDSKFAVSSGGLADALVRVSSVAADANLTLNETIGLITAIKQTTGRSEAVIGNSLKTILTKVQAPDVLRELEAIGVATKGVNGESLNAIKILSNLSAVYGQLSSSQKFFISQNIANLYQINSLKAIFKDLGSDISNYQQAVEAAADSSGFAQKRINELNRTLSSQIQILKNDFAKAFSNIGNIVIKPVLGGGIGAIQTILERLNKAKQGSGGAGEGVLSSISGKGFEAAFKTLGSILTGPGLQIGLVLILNLFKKLSVFAFESARDISGISTAAQKRALIEQGVKETLAGQNNILSSIIDGTLKAGSAASRIKSEWMEANKAAAAHAQIVSSLSGAIIASPGVRLVQGGAQGGTRGRGSASSGLIPNLSPEAEETMGAYAGGYKPGSIREMSVPKLGRIYYNTAETVKKFPQFEQPAIMPPPSSKAGRAYKGEFEKAHGFNPYKADGMIPKYKVYHDGNFYGKETLQAGKGIENTEHRLTSLSQLTDPKTTYFAEGLRPYKEEGSVPWRNPLASLDRETTHRMTTRNIGHESQYHTLEIFKEGAENEVHTSKRLGYLHSKIPKGSTPVQAEGMVPNFVRGFNPYKSGGFVPPKELGRQFKLGNVNYDLDKGIGETPYGRSIDHYGVTSLMSPQDFRKLAIPFSTNIARESLSYKHIQEAIKSGKPLAPLQLYLKTSKYHPGAFSVAGHEGRHRSLALQDLGNDIVPVQLLATREGFRNKDFNVNLLKKLNMGVFPEGNAEMSKNSALAGMFKHFYDNQGLVNFASGFNPYKSHGFLPNQRGNPLKLLHGTRTPFDLKDAKPSLKSEIASAISRQKAEKYFDIGHEGEGNKTFVYDLIEKKIKDGSGDKTHGMLFGHEYADKHFKGRYDKAANKASLVFPDHAKRGTSGDPTADDIPTAVYNAIKRKYRTDSIETFASGLVPNLAKIPILSKLIGRVATNVVDPSQGFGLNSFHAAYDYVRKHGLTKAIKEVALDRPIYKDAEHFKNNTLDGEGLSEFAFRHMFGLKPRTELKAGRSLKKIGKNRYQTDAEYTKRLTSSPGGGEVVRNNKLVGLHYDQDLGGYLTTFDPKKETVSYEDTWDFDLHPGDKRATLKGVASEIKGLLGVRRNVEYIKDVLNSPASLQEKITNIKEVFTPRSIADSAKAFRTTALAHNEHGYASTHITTLLRQMVGAVSTPITFAGSRSIKPRTNDWDNFIETYLEKSTKEDQAALRQRTEIQYAQSVPKDPRRYDERNFANVLRDQLSLRNSNPFIESGLAPIASRYGSIRDVDKTKFSHFGRTRIQYGQTRRERDRNPFLSSGLVPNLAAYGHWITPSGEMIEVPYQGHQEKGHELLRERHPDLDPDNGVYSQLFKKGYWRSTTESDKVNIESSGVDKRVPASVLRSAKDYAIEGKKRLYNTSFNAEGLRGPSILYHPHNQKMNPVDSHYFSGKHLLEENHPEAFEELKKGSSGDRINVYDALFDKGYYRAVHIGKSLEVEGHMSGSTPMTNAMRRSLKNHGIENGISVKDVTRGENIIYHPNDVFNRGMVPNISTASSGLNPYKSAGMVPNLNNKSFFSPESPYYIGNMEKAQAGYGAYVLKDDSHDVPSVKIPEDYYSNPQKYKTKYKLNQAPNIIGKLIHGASRGAVPNLSPLDDIRKLLHGKKIALDRSTHGTSSHGIGRALARLTSGDQQELLSFFQNPVLDSSRILDVRPGRNEGESQINYIAPSKSPTGVHMVLAVHPDRLDKAQLMTIKYRRGIAAKGLVPNLASSYTGRGVADKTIIQRLTEGARKGASFANFYDRYQSEHGLSNLSDRELFDKIYASQSFRADDKTVFSQAIKIFEGHKGGKTDFSEEIEPLGVHGVRKRILSNVLSGGEFETKKTSVYFDALQGNKSAVPFDAHFLETAAGEKLGESGKITTGFSKRLLELTRGQVSAATSLDPRAVQAAVFAARSGKGDFGPFEKGFERLRNFNGAKGLVPNLAAKKLGSGFYGDFYALNRQEDGLRLGSKHFPSAQPSQGFGVKGIQQEYDMSLRLQNLKGINPLFYFPRVFEKKPTSIIKERVEGKTVQETTGKPYDISQGILPIQRAIDPFQMMMKSQLEGRQIIAKDVVGHTENTMLNEKAEEIFKKVSRSPVALEKFLDHIDLNPKRRARIATAMAKKGARMSFVDPGNFETMAARGLVPNLASLLGSGLYGSFYDLNSNYQGSPVGYKDFRRGGARSPADVSGLVNTEYKMSRRTSQLEGLPSYLRFPKVFGSLDGSLELGRVYKEVARGRTGDQSIIDSANPNSHEKILDAMSETTYRVLGKRGIEANDLHPGNYIINDRAHQMIGDLAANSRFVNKHINGPTRLDRSTEKAFNRHFNRIGQEGGHMTIIDVGNFRQKSRGLVPNLAMDPTDFYNENIGLFATENGQKEFIKKARKEFPQEIKQAGQNNNFLHYDEKDAEHKVTNADRILGKIFGFKIVSEKDWEKFYHSKKSPGTQFFGNANYKLPDAFVTKPKPFYVDDKLEETRAISGLQPSISAIDILTKYGIDPNKATGTDLQKAAMKEFPAEKGTPYGFFLKARGGFQSKGVAYGGKGILNKDKLTETDLKEMFIQRIIPETYKDTPQYRVDVVGTQKGFELAGIRQKGKNSTFREAHVGFDNSPEALQVLAHAAASTLSIPPNKRSGIHLGYDIFPKGIVEANPDTETGLSGGTNALFTTIKLGSGLLKNRSERVSDFISQGQDILGLNKRSDQSKALRGLNSGLQDFRHDEGGYYKAALELAKQGFNVDFGSGKKRRTLSSKEAIAHFAKMGIKNRGLVPNLSIPNLAATFIGSGAVGSFYDTKRKIGKTELGIKKFSNAYAPAVQREYEASKYVLEEKFPEGVAFPKIFGSLKSSLRKNRIGKEVIRGQTLSEVADTYPYSTDVYSTVSDYVNEPFREKGIRVSDLGGTNIVLDNKTITLIDKTLQEKRGKSIDRTDLEKIIKEGGRFYPIDLGIAKIPPDKLSAFRSKHGISADTEKNRFKGLVPNLFVSPIQDALNRENRATGGRAMLDFSSELVTPANPSGAVAVTSGSQGSAKEAIRQHRAMGQSMSQIKTARTASYGRVPNLTIFGGGGSEDGSAASGSVLDTVALSFLQFGYQMQFAQNGLQKLGGVAKFLATSQEKVLNRNELWVKSLTDAEIKLKAGAPDAQVRNDQGQYVTVRNEADIQAVRSTPQAQAVIQTTAKAKEERENRINNTRSLGYKTSIGAAIGGSIASSIFTGKDAQQGIEKISAGFSTAGQVLTVFQGKVGKAAAATVAMTGLLQGLDAFGKGLGKLEAGFNKDVDRIQKNVVSLDALSVSYQKLDDMLHSSVAGLDSINAEFNTIRDTLITLNSNGPRGEQIAREIEGAGSTESRQVAINKAKRLETKELTNKANTFGLQTLAAERSTSLFGTLGAGSVFSSGNAVDKAKANEQVLATASSIRTDFSGSDDESKAKKARLYESAGDLNLLKEVLEKDSAYFRETIKILDQSNKSPARLKKDTDIIVKRVQIEALQGANDENPEVKAILKTNRDRSSSRQAQKQDFIANEFNLQRQVLGQGGAAGSINASIFSFNKKAGFDKTTEILAARKGKLETDSQFQGPKTTLRQATAIESSSIKNEANIARNEITGKATKELIKGFAPLNDYLVGKGTDKDGNAVNVNEQNFKVAKGLNRGLANAAKGPDFENFIKNKDFSGLADNIVQGANIGADDKEKLGETEKNALRTKLETVGNDPATIKLLEETVAAIKESDHSAEQRNNRLLEEEKEQNSRLDKLRSASAFGGTNILTDRGAARRASREINHGLSLFEKGKTAEQRGRGAIKLLQAIKDSGGEIDETNPQHAKYLKAAAEGTKSRIDSVFTRLGTKTYDSKGIPATDIRQIFLNNLKPKSLTSGVDSVNKEFLPEKKINAQDGKVQPVANLFKQATDELAENTTDFSRATAEATASLYALVNNLGDIQQRYEGAKKERADATKAFDAEEVKDDDTLREAHKKNDRAPTPPPLKKGQKPETEQERLKREQDEKKDPTNGATSSNSIPFSTLAVGTTLGIGSTLALSYAHAKIQRKFNPASPSGPSLPSPTGGGPSLPSPTGGGQQPFGSSSQPYQRNPFAERGLATPAPLLPPGVRPTSIPDAFLPLPVAQVAPTTPPVSKFKSFIDFVKKGSRAARNAPSVTGSSRAAKIGRLAVGLGLAAGVTAVGINQAKAGEFPQEGDQYPPTPPPVPAPEPLREPATEHGGVGEKLKGAGLLTAGITAAAFLRSKAGGGSAGLKGNAVLSGVLAAGQFLEGDVVGGVKTTGEELAKITAIKAASKLAGKGAAKYGTERLGGKVLTNLLAPVGRNAKINGGGGANLAANVAFGLYDSTIGSKVDNGGALQENIDSALGYANFVPGARAATTVARAGLRVGNALYTANLGGIKDTDNIYENIDKKESQNANRYFHKDVSGQKKEALISSIQTTQAQLRETSSKDVLKFANVKGEHGYERKDREIEKLTAAIESMKAEYQKMASEEKGRGGATNAEGQFSKSAAVKIESSPLPINIDIAFSNIDSLSARLGPEIEDAIRGFQDSIVDRVSQIESKLGLAPRPSTV